MPSTVYTEPIHSHEWFLSKGNGQRSAEAVTFSAAASTFYRNGTVLGRITATGKYVPHNNSASDGSQTAAAILLYNVEKGDARDEKVTVYARDVEVWGAKLNDGAGVAADQIAELEAVGIIVR